MDPLSLRVSCNNNFWIMFGHILLRIIRALSKSGSLMALSMRGIHLWKRRAMRSYVLSKDVVHRILIRTCMCSIAFGFCWEKITCFQYLNLSCINNQKNTRFFLRFFRLVADLKIPADLAVAMLLDAQKIGCKDYALATVQFFHTFPDQQSFVVCLGAW